MTISHLLIGNRRLVSDYPGIMIYRQFRSPQAEYRREERDRVETSGKLIDQFPRLKLMTVNLDYSCPDEVLKNRRLKYVINLANARSVFIFGCPNTQCSRGDFDLTQPLAEVIARGETTFSGVISCPGWVKDSLRPARCPNQLHYRFNFTYSPAPKAVVRR